MKHSLWVEISFADKYIKYFLKNGTLIELNLTSSEYFVVQFLITVNKKLSFYEIKKLIPIEPKQLHLIIKSLVEKKILEREFKDKTSEIWVPNHSKDTINYKMLSNYKVLNSYFSEEKTKLLLELLKEFNMKCRIGLGRK